MARVKQPHKEAKVVRVYCSDCRNFQRDTEGSSFRFDTHEYFMGICLKGLTPDSPKKQFADKPRTCKEYKPL
jgi:hypothetical protein